LTFAAFGCSWLQSHPLEIEDCRIVALHKSMARRESGKAEEKADCRCSDFAVAAAVGCSAGAGTWRSSGIEDSRTRLAFLAGRENRVAIEMVVRE